METQEAPAEAPVVEVPAAETPVINQLFQKHQTTVLQLSNVEVQNQEEAPAAPQSAPVAETLLKHQFIPKLQ